MVYRALFFLLFNIRGLTLVDIVKVYFDYDFQKRPNGRETIWTLEDEKKYENLTIVGFRIYGDTTIVH